MRILIFFISLVMSQSLLAQILEGNIVYESKQNLHRRIPADQADMRNRIPEFQVSQMELLFNRESSLYKEVEDDEPSGGGRGFRMRFGGVTVFTDLVNEQRTESRDFFGENYLIEDEVRIFPWKLEGATKMIAGKMCQLAYCEIVEDSMYIEAWFSPEIPLSLGPENFRGLPGAILQLDINLGERTLTAVSIKETKIKEKDLKAPTKGKKVSEQEYKEMVEKRMEEFRSQGRGGGVRFSRG